MCCDLLFSKVDMPIDKETFITLASISSCDVIFNTHDGFYKQIDGLAMGSPPAPHLANGWLRPMALLITLLNVVLKMYILHNRK